MGTRLYVGNLPYDSTEADLRAAFEEGGGCVTDVHIPADRETGKSRGFAFVEMGSDAEAEAAIDEMNDAEFQGRLLRVNEAKPKTRN
jgi:cold-inducible RNA-binding protein